MKTLAVSLAVFFIGSCVFAQTREFQLTKITKNFVSTPQYTYSGAQQYPTNQRDRWLEVEVEFSATPDFTDELTFKYFILMNGKLLTGEVTHVNVAAGRDNRSVMYVSPRALARFAGNGGVNSNSIQNVAVQITQIDKSSDAYIQPVAMASNSAVFDLSTVAPAGTTSSLSTTFTTPKLTQ